MTSNQAYCIIKMYTNIIYNMYKINVYRIPVCFYSYSSFYLPVLFCPIVYLYWNVCADFNMCLNDQKYFSHKIIQKNKVYEALFYCRLAKREVTQSSSSCIYTKKRIDDYFKLYSSSFLLFDEIIFTHLEKQWIFVLCPIPKKIIIKRVCQNLMFDLVGVSLLQFDGLFFEIKSVQENILKNLPINQGDGPTITCCFGES